MLSYVCSCMFVVPSLLLLVLLLNFSVPAAVGAFWVVSCVPSPCPPRWCPAWGLQVSRTPRWLCSVVNVSVCPESRTCLVMFIINMRGRRYKSNLLGHFLLTLWGSEYLMRTSPTRNNTFTPSQRNMSQILNTEDHGRVLKYVNMLLRWITYWYYKL